MHSINLELASKNGKQRVLVDPRALVIVHARLVATLIADWHRLDHVLAIEAIFFCFRAIAAEASTKTLGFSPRKVQCGEEQTISCKTRSHHTGDSIVVQFAYMRCHSINRLMPFMTPPCLTRDKHSPCLETLFLVHNKGILQRHLLLPQCVDAM